MINIYSLIAVLALSFVLTYLLRIYAIKKDVIDIPNERSSHSLPTPRGGGVAVVLSYLAVLAYMDLWLFFTAGLLVASIGWLDDHGHVKSVIRLFVHIIGSALVVYQVGGLPDFVLLGFEINLGMTGGVLAVIGLTWILNLYNFMDGIDGIAGVEAVTSTLIAGLIIWQVFGMQDQASLHFLLMASSLGFLLWNWPPAKIFMGDAGSGFLGLMLGALLLYSTSAAPEMLWVWLIMLGVFIVDATYTLLRRLIRGDKVYQAHRSHAYQYASRKLGGHLPVTFSVLAINLLWLAPWAYAVATGLIDGFTGLFLAYLLILWLVWHFRAGETESNQIE